MIACDNCQSTEQVERATIAITGQTVCAENSVEFCQSCLASMAADANTVLRPINHHGLTGGRPPEAPEETEGDAPAERPAAIAQAAPVAAEEPQETIVPSPAPEAVTVPETAPESVTVTDTTQPVVAQPDISEEEEPAAG